MTLGRLTKWFRGNAASKAGVPDVKATAAAIPDYRPVFGTLAMPNGRRIVTMREDVFRAALAAAAGKSNR